jgi:hypothetical protein
VTSVVTAGPCDTFRWSELHSSIAPEICFAVFGVMSVSGAPVSKSRNGVHEGIYVLAFGRCFMC